MWMIIKVDVDKFKKRIKMYFSFCHQKVINARKGVIRNRAVCILISQYKANFVTNTYDKLGSYFFV